VPRYGHGHGHGHGHLNLTLIFPYYSNFKTGWFPDPEISRNRRFF